MLYSSGPCCLCFIYSGACLHAQSCPALYNPVDCSPSGSSVSEIFQGKSWSELPFPPTGDLPDPGIELASPVSPALAGGFFTTETWEAVSDIVHVLIPNF